MSTNEQSTVCIVSNPEHESENWKHIEEARIAVKDIELNPENQNINQALESISYKTGALLLIGELDHRSSKELRAKAIRLAVPCTVISLAEKPEEVTQPLTRWLGAVTLHKEPFKRLVR